MRRLSWKAIVASCCAALGQAQWSAHQQAEVLAEATTFCFGTALAASGDVAFVSTIDTVHVFEVDGDTGTWEELQTLVPPSFVDVFGQALAAAGDTLLVGQGEDDGAQGNSGSVYVYERDAITGLWTEVVRLDPSDPVQGGQFGSAVALSGDTALVGAFGGELNGIKVGAAYVFERDAGGPDAWGQVAKITSEQPGKNDGFGKAVALDGDLAFVSAPGADVDDNGEETGEVWVLDRNQGGANQWGSIAVLRASDGADEDAFGAALALCGPTLAAGAPMDDHAGGVDAGAVYVFQGSGSNWTEVAKVTADDAAGGDHFGVAVNVEDDTLVVGAPAAGNDHGAAYAYKREQGGHQAWGQVAELQPFFTPVAFDRFGTAVAVVGGLVAGSESRDEHEQVGELAGLAYDPVGGVLYAADRVLGKLSSVHPAWALAQPIGSLGFAQVEGLAFDAGAGVLYGVDAASGQLLEIDTQTGQGTAIGAIGFGDVRGLEFDPLTGTLYGADNSTDQLIEIDVATGAGTAIGPLGFIRVQGLALDPATGTLFGCDAASDQLIAIDTRTGAGSLIGPIGYTQMIALAHGPDGLLGVDVVAQQLIAIDALTGAGTALGGFSTQLFQGAVHVFQLTHAAEGYCTAGTSASGCTALIAASGQASASASSGLVLTAAGVEGAKDGLFFFGSHGKQAQPWGNGTSYQCVMPPVRRTGLLDGSGTPGACDGAFARDLNAYWCPTCPAPAANPGAGAMIQAQLWYRDPASTSNQPTSLSDAVESYVTP